MGNLPNSIAAPDPLSVATQNIGSYGMTAQQAVQQKNNTVSNPAAIIVPAVISLIGTIASIASSNAMAKRQNKYNEEMIDKQNAYNSPSSQMERLREAGLNPYLAMQQGGVTAGSQDNPQEKVAEPGLAGLKLDQLIPLLSLYSQLQLNQANIGRLNADAELKTAQALTETTKQEYNRAQSRKADTWVNDLAPELVKQVQAATQLTAEKVKWMPVKELMDIQWKYADISVKNATVERFSKLNGLTEAQTQETLQKVQNLQQEIAESKARIAELNARSALEYTEAANKATATEVLEIDKEIKREEVKLKQQQQTLAKEQARLYGTKADFIPVETGIKAVNAVTGAVDAIIPG